MPATLKNPAVYPPGQTTGRPALQIADFEPRIIEQLELGTSLNKICSQPDMPDYSVVCRWLRKDAEFYKNYVRAREFFFDLTAMELVELSDSATPENAHAVRLQVETRKWIASKLLPKKYGDRPAEITVNNTTNVLVVNEDRRAQLMERRRLLTSAKPANVIDAP